MSFDIAQARQLLRQLREGEQLSRAALSKRTKRKKSEPPVSAQTIADIETGAGDPGIQTFARVIEALPGVTFSDFLLQIERQTAADSTELPQSDTNEPSHKLRGGGLDGQSHPVSEARLAEILEEIGIHYGRFAKSLRGGQGAADRETGTSPPSRPRRSGDD